MSESELRPLLAELLEAYKRESGPLNDEREPQRYREWAQELVARVENALQPHDS
jgi:hypothetical protein